MDLDVEPFWSVNQYPCRKGCKREFTSSWARKKHEDSFDCPIVDFENPSSPQLHYPVMLDSLRVQPTEVLNYNHGIYYEDIALEEVVKTNYTQLSNMQPTNRGNPQSTRVNEMMTIPNVSGYDTHEQHKVIDTKKALTGTRDKKWPLDLSEFFSKDTPDILKSEEETSEGKEIKNEITKGINTEITKEINTGITLTELNGENSVGSTDPFSLENPISPRDLGDVCEELLSLEESSDFRIENPIQVPVVSGSQQYVNSQFDQLNWTFIPTRSGFYQSIEEIISDDFPNLLDYLDEGNDAHPAFVVTRPSMMPIEPQMSARPAVATVAPLVLEEPQPQEPPKRGRGRPRKQKPLPVLETQQLEYREWNMHASYPILCDRKSKIASREKIRSAIFGGFESGASDQEYSPVNVESPRKKARKTLVREDPDYEDVTQSSDASSSTSPEGHDGKVAERRKKNNLSSGKSRQKRKEINKMMEVKRTLLEKRFKKLSAAAATLEEAVGVLRRLLVRCLAEKKSAA